MNDYVQSKVGPPGIALALFGVVSILLNLLGAVFQLIGAFAQLMALMDDFTTEALISFLTSSGIYIILGLMSFAASFLIAFSGLRLRSARSAGLVYAGAIMAALPCCSGYCCCWFGIPIAIWVIVTMQDEQVKAAFSESF